MLGGAAACNKDDPECPELTPPGSSYQTKDRKPQDQQILFEAQWGCESQPTAAAIPAGFGSLGSPPLLGGPHRSPRFTSP